MKPCMYFSLKKGLKVFWYFLLLWRVNLGSCRICKLYVANENVNLVQYEITKPIVVEIFSKQHTCCMENISTTIGLLQQNEESTQINQRNN